MLVQENPITISSEMPHNKAYLQGTRIPVWHLVSMLDDGMTEDQILKQHPSLSLAELKAAIKYAGTTAVSV